LSFRTWPFWMLAGETGLELLDLFLDFLFAIAGGKEDVVRIGQALLPFPGNGRPRKRHRPLQYPA